MRNFDKLLQESSTIHGHHCAGQVLGVRMAMLGCREVGIDEPKGCKKLVVYVEMDRCATDAMQAVTGCSLGKRTLKFLDYGKMAATFVNTETGKAVRVLAKDDARALTPRFAPGAATPREAQKQAYRVMPEDTLFSWSPVALRMAPQEMPGYRGERVQCAVCGEGINFRREVEAGGRILCIPCAQGGIISNGNGVGIRSSPKILLIVGYKKVGKTTLIENLIPELSRRGYRVGTVKHHHSDIPAAVDTAGHGYLETPTSRSIKRRFGDPYRYRRFSQQQQFARAGSARVRSRSAGHRSRRRISRRTPRKNRGPLRCDR